MPITKKKADALFRRFSEINPHPKTELHYSSPFTLLVAVVLSAQATDVSVNKATPALFAAADTPEKMAALGEEGIRRHIRTIGLFNAKAKNIHALSKALLREQGGEVPRSREALEALPGVGRKTANVILNCLWGEKVIAVDTHVQRVANRLGLASSKTPAGTEGDLERSVPEAWKEHAHHWLILHGRYVCKARKPECWRCAVRDLCGFPAKTEKPLSARA